MAYILTIKDYPDTDGDFVAISDTAEEMEMYLKEEFFLDIFVEELKKEGYLYIDTDEWYGRAYEIEEVEKVGKIGKRKPTGKRISELYGFEDFLYKISLGYHEKEWRMSKEKYLKHAKRELCNAIEKLEEEAKEFDKKN